MPKREMVTRNSCHGKKEAEQGHQDTSALEFVAFGGRDSVKDPREARDHSFPETHVCVQSVVLEAASQLRVKTPYKFLRSRKRPRVSRSVAEERAGDTAAVNPGHTSTKVDP